MKLASGGADLKKTASVPTPEVRAKAAELIKNAKTDAEKVQAIYDFVALKFRYVSISFGIGRFQPHAAEDVLKDAYGDCKDKHTLLAALLKAVGIEAESALINSALKLDPEVPSPGQFDHVISLVPLVDGPAWLDTTTEVAPFRYLTYNLRAKQALVVRPGKLAVLMTTPADPPFESSQEVTVDGKLGEDGTLDATLRWVFRDDSGVLLRAAFRNTAQNRWKDIVQSISYASGYGGEVSAVNVSPPDATASPFQYSYRYIRKEFSDWANKRITAPLPPFALPQLSEEPQDTLKSVNLGQPAKSPCHSSVEVPKGYTPQLLPTVDLKRDFAEYHSEYSFKDGALTAERRLLVKMREVPPSERADYKSFWKAITDEYATYTDLRNGSSPAVAMKPPTPKALELFNRAREAYMKRDMNGALDSLEEAVKVDPTFEAGWLMLAGFRLSMNEIRNGMDAVRKALALNPVDTQPYKLLASQLSGQNHEQEAADVWNELLKRHPNDPDVHANLGSLLLKQMKYSEARDQFEAAVKAEPARADVQYQLGRVYLKLNERDKAMTAFNLAAGSSKDPVTLNKMAFELAENNLHLEEAAGWAEQAVQAEEIKSAGISTDNLSRSDLQCMEHLAAFWDTMGWVYFRQGNLEKARRYLESAWALSQDAVAGEHLGKVYEKEGKKVAAAHQLALAKAARGNEGPSPSFSAATVLTQPSGPRSPTPQHSSFPRCAVSS